MDHAVPRLERANQEVSIFNFRGAGIPARLFALEEIMKRKNAGGRVLPADWTEAVGKVQEVLTQAENEAGEREKSLANFAPAVESGEKAVAWKHGLGQFQERLQLFQAKIQQAEEDAAEAELALSDGEKTLEHWLARANDITRRAAKIQADTGRSDVPPA